MVRVDMIDGTVHPVIINRNGMTTGTHLTDNRRDREAIGTKDSGTIDGPMMIGTIAGNLDATNLGTVNRRNPAFNVN